VWSVPAETCPTRRLRSDPTTSGSGGGAAKVESGKYGQSTAVRARSAGIAALVPDDEPAGLAEPPDENLVSPVGRLYLFARESDVRTRSFQTLVAWADSG
jgi:hypothetical protein